MTVIGTSKESNFSIFLFLHAEEIADRIVAEIKKPEYDELVRDDFTLALIEAMYKEIYQLYPIFQAEIDKPGQKLMPIVTEELRVRIRKELRVRMGVRNKKPVFGLIQPSLEFHGVIKIIYRMAHGGYINAAIKDKRIDRAKRCSRVEQSLLVFRSEAGDNVIHSLYKFTGRSKPRINKRK